jgi:polar amino acid transport system substrate-binding protein
MNVTRLLPALLFAALAGCATAPQGPSATAVAQLAPTGSVRVALLMTNPNFVTVSPGGEVGGVSVEIGKAIAARAGKSFEGVRYNSIVDILKDAGANKWDVAMMGIEPDRRAAVELSNPVFVTENTYLVPAGSALMTIRDVDRSGVVVTVAERSAQHNYLKDNLKDAKLVATKATTDAAAQVAAGQAQAMAANRSTLEELAGKMPGSRVLAGSYSLVTIGMGVPKGRAEAAALVDDVLREMRANGAIASAVKRANLKGVIVP